MEQQVQPNSDSSFSSCRVKAEWQRPGRRLYARSLSHVLRRAAAWQHLISPVVRDREPQPDSHGGIGSASVGPRDEGSTMATKTVSTRACRCGREEDLRPAVLPKSGGGRLGCLYKYSLRATEYSAHTCRRATDRPVARPRRSHVCYTAPARDTGRRRAARTLAQCLSCWAATATMTSSWRPDAV